MTYGDRRAAAAGPGRAARGRAASAYAYDADQPLLDDLDFAVEPGRTVALVGATASGKSTLTTLLTRLVDPDAGGGAASTARPARPRPRRAGAARRARPADGVPLRRHRPRQRHARARTSTDDAGLGTRCAPPRPTASSPPCPTGSTPGSASAARPCPAGSASGSRWPARWSADPRLLVLDDATSAVDPEVEARILAAPARRRRRRHARRGRLPQGHHRAGRRGGLPRRRPGRRPRHPRRAAGPQPGVRPPGQRLRGEHPGSTARPSTPSAPARPAHEHGRQRHPDGHRRGHRRPGDDPPGRRASPRS